MFFYKLKFKFEAHFGKKPMCPDASGCVRLFLVDSYKPMRPDASGCVFAIHSSNLNPDTLGFEQNVNVSGCVRMCPAVFGIFVNI